MHTGGSTPSPLKPKKRLVPTQVSGANTAISTPKDLLQTPAAQLQSPSGYTTFAAPLPLFQVVPSTMQIIETDSVRNEGEAMQRLVTTESLDDSPDIIKLEHEMEEVKPGLSPPTIEHIKEEPQTTEDIEDVITKSVIIGKGASSLIPTESTLPSIENAMCNQQVQTSEYANLKKQLEAPTIKTLDDYAASVKKEHEVEMGVSKSASSSPIREQIHEEHQITDTVTENITVSYIVKEEPLSPNSDEITQQKPSRKKSACHKQVQTSEDMVLYAPRILKLRGQMETRNYVLQQKIAQLSKENKSVSTKITFEHYKRLTYQFCPSKSVADDVIKMILNARGAAKSVKASGVVTNKAHA